MRFVFKTIKNLYIISDDQLKFETQLRAGVPFILRGCNSGPFSFLTALFHYPHNRHLNSGFFYFGLSFYTAIPGIHYYFIAVVNVIISVSQCFPLIATIIIII